jgi:hypothetical protein
MRPEAEASGYQSRGITSRTASGYGLEVLGIGLMGMVNLRWAGAVALNARCSHLRIEIWGTRVRRVGFSRRAEEGRDRLRYARDSHISKSRYGAPGAALVCWRSIFERSLHGICIYITITGRE